MSFLKRLFGAKDSDKTVSTDAEISPYMTLRNNLPIDEQFTFNFKKNGGKFLYCENMEEIYEHFENILVENDWFESEVLCFNSNLFDMLEHNKLVYTNSTNPVFVFSNCESLIADEGSILFSSNQVKSYKINDLPENMVVFAKMSQIKPHKGDGMSEIKRLYQPNFPTNITTIRNFDIGTKSNENSLQYSSAPKNLYLLLLEDL
jgi:hypothetical protein